MSFLLNRFIIRMFFFVYSERNRYRAKTAVCVYVWVCVTSSYTDENSRQTIVSVMTTAGAFCPTAEYWGLFRDTLKQWITIISSVIWRYRWIYVCCVIVCYCCGVKVAEPEWLTLLLLQVSIINDESRGHIEFDIIIVMSISPEIVINKNL